MKSVMFFFAMVVFGFGTLAAAGSHMLVFETAEGEILTMEAYQEQDVREDVPVILRPVVCGEGIDPENHEYFRVLVQQLQKPEKEEPLPYGIN